MVTGNPSSDGWRSDGNSLAPGTFINQTASWSFNVYNTTFTLTTGNPLINGTTWQTGDQVLGMGGVLPFTQPIMPRLVAKFGTAPTTFSPSTTPAANLPPAIDNYSPTVDGNGTAEPATKVGIGDFMVTYGYKSDNPSRKLDPVSQNNAILAASGLYITYGGVLGAVSGDWGRVLAVFQTDSQGNLVIQDDPILGNTTPTSQMPVLQSFETFIDVSQLQRTGYTQLPSLGDSGDMALQFKTDSFTGGYVSPIPEPGMFTGGYLSPIPEPDTFVASGLITGLGLLLNRSRRPARS